MLTLRGVFLGPGFFFFSRNSHVTHLKEITGPSFNPVAIGNLGGSHDC